MNAAGADGLFHGNPLQFWIQIKATVLTAAFSFVASFALLWLVDKALGLRVSDQDERIGLDLTQHRETAYTLLD